MDDSLKTLDLSAEGTVSVPPVVETPPIVTPPPVPEPVIVTQSSGPTDKKPMGKKTKIVAGVLSAILLFAGLGIGLFLAKQRQNIKSRAADNTCNITQDCGNDPAKWEAGWYAAREPDNVNKAPAQTEYTSTGDVIRYANEGNNIDRRDGVADVTPNQPAANTTTNNTTSTASNLPSKPSSNTSSDNLTIGKDGGWIVKDSVAGQKVDNACNVTLTCKTRTDWEKGWFDARRESQYLSGNVVAKQPEYTDIARDLDNNPSNGIQVGTITNSGGVLEIKDVFTVTSTNTGTCALNDYSCIEKYLQANPGANNSISLSGKVGYIDKNGKIVFNSATSDSLGGGIPSNLILTASQCSSSSSCCGWLNPSTGNTVWFDGSKDIATKTCYQQAYDYTKKLFTWGNKISGTYCTNDSSATSCSNYYNVFGWNGMGFNTSSCSTLCSQQSVGLQGACCSDGNGNICVNTAGAARVCGKLNTNGYYCQAGNGFTAQDLQNKMPANGQTAVNAGCNTGSTGANAFDPNRACGIQQLDVDLVDANGNSVFHASRNLLDLSGCSTPPSIVIPPTYNPPKPPTTTTTTNGGPTPTPTAPVSSYACYQLQIFRGTTQIQPWQVNVGDSVIFRGFATATNTTVSKMRFIVSINGVAQAPVDVNASLIAGQYQADLPYTITQAASYSVTTAPISP